MKTLSRFCEVLTYLAMVYAGFTAIVVAAALIRSNYAHFGWIIFAVTIAGQSVALLFRVLKKRWIFAIIAAVSAAVRVYISYLLMVRSGLDMAVFYKQHLPALLVAVFALLTALFWRAYQKAAVGITFCKADSDRARAEEQAAALTETTEETPAEELPTEETPAEERPAEEV